MVQTAASTIGQVIDHWVVALTTLYAGDSTTFVVDGPLGGISIDEGQAFIAVGASEPDDGGDDDQGAVGQQAWRTVGAQSRTETYEIPCFVLATDGSALKTCRDRCLAVMAAISDAVKADPGSGGLVAVSTTVTGQDLFQQANSSGWTATLRFALSVQNVVR